MTVILRDTFTGGDDSDISGRTPDGGGDGGLAIGTWAYAYRASGLDTLAIASGALVPPAGTLDTVVAIVTGHGLVSPDYSVRQTFTVTVPDGGLVFVGPGLGIASDGSEGYLATASFFDDFVTYTIYDFSSGGYAVLAQDDGDTPTPAGEVTLDLSREGTTLRLLVNGVQVLEVDDDTYTAVGNPGVEMDNTDAGSEPEAACTLFEVDDTPTGGGGTTDACTFLASRHEFYDPARADVDGQRTDSFPGLGTLTRHPASVAAVAEAGSEGRIVGGGRAVYLDSGIEGQVDGDPVALGNDYCADAVVQFPKVTTNPTGTPPGCTAFLRWERWQYIITGIDSDFPGDPEPHSITPVVGFCDELTSSQTIAGVNIAGFETWDNGQPKHYELDCFGAGAFDGGSFRTIKFFTTAFTLGGEHDWPDAVLDWTYSSTPVPTAGPAPYYGDFLTDWEVAGVSDAFYLTGGDGLGPSVSPTSGTASGDGTPRTLTATTVTLQLTHALFTNHVSAPGGTGGMVFDWDEYLLDDTEIFIICTPPTDPGDEGEGEHAAAEVLVRYDAVDDSGYGLRLQLDHEGGEILGTATFFKRTAGSESVFSATGMELAHNVPYQIKISVSGSTLVARLNGGSLGTADDADFATGDPGFGGYDETVTDPYLLFEQFSVYNPDTEIQPPCDPPGDGDPPGTTDPPPGPLQLGYWVRRNLEWRFVPLPTAEFPTSGTQAQRNLLPRPVSLLTGATPDAFAVRRNLAWRSPVAQTGEGDPPSVSPYPPGYDPCEEAPPIDTPPDVTIGAPPDRLFFAWHITATQTGPLWTATYMAMGPAILTGISQAAARGSAIFGTPGDKRKFFRGGRYASDLMDAWIYSLAPIASAVLAAQAAGSFAGVHAADDWENPALWPPYGLPLTEINRIAAVWKTVFPGLRVMLRARTGQIGGTSMPNIDGVISQMRMTGTEWEAAGRTATGYAEGELDFCQDRGWILHLSQNFYNGLQVRHPMTAAQVLDNGLQWVDVVGSHPHGGAVYGMGGWQFFPSSGFDVTGGDYLDAYAGWRNAMIPLGPPTFP